MSIISILKDLDKNKKVEAKNAVALKAKRLNDVYDINIQRYLFNKLNNIYLCSESIYNILFGVIRMYNNDIGHYDKTYITKGDCYYFSAAIIHAMEQNDLLVNGNLAPEHSDGYEHQWVEFCFNNEWYVLDSALRKVYNRKHYHSVFKPVINFKKSKDELMKDDYVRKHGELLRNPEWSYDDKLFLYYKGDQIEECRKRLYEDIEVDETGYIISYNGINIQKGHSK